MSHSAVSTRSGSRGGFSYKAYHRESDKNVPYRLCWAFWSPVFPGTVLQRAGGGSVRVAPAEGGGRLGAAQPPLREPASGTAILRLPAARTGGVLKFG